MLYPGKPEKMPPQAPWHLKSSLSKVLNYDLSEFDALWDQFTCLANAKFEDDPSNIGWAIDRRAFDKTFVPHYSTDVPPPNLIYDRLFAFYDSDGNGLIGFEEFIRGLACVHSKTSESRLKEVFNGYDIDADGYVSRKDLLRMFRAYYAITKDITRDFIAVQEEELAAAGALDTIMSAQPLSSAFTDHPIIPGEHTTRWRKLPDAFGDLRPANASDPVVRSNGEDEGDRGTIIANAKQYSMNHPTGADGFPRQYAPDVRREVIQDRWRRRDFYLDEEGGLERSEEFKPQSDDEENAEESGLPEQAGSDLCSALNRRQSSGSRTAHSRSSSRVRFQDDPEVDTRSNASTSSRPVGERWGGYEIPQAEEALGREVLYQVTQQAFNELLDPIFKEKEDLAIEVESTRQERKRWAKRIAELAEKQKAAQQQSEATEKDPLLAIPAATEKESSNAANDPAETALQAYNRGDSPQQSSEAEQADDRYINETTTMRGLMQSAHALAAQGVVDDEGQTIEDSSFLDPEISEKPLDELLDQSGYTTAEDSPLSWLDETTLVPSFILEDPTWAPPPPPQGLWPSLLHRDPTLPQNMPSGLPTRPSGLGEYYFPPWDFERAPLPIRILEYPRPARSLQRAWAIAHGHAARTRALAVLADVDAIATSPLSHVDRELWPTAPPPEPCRGPPAYLPDPEQLRFVDETLQLPVATVRRLCQAIEDGWARPLDIEIADFRRRNLLDEAPSAARLERLLFLDKAEEEIKQRGGRGGRLSFEEFERAVEDAEGRLGFVESWLDMGSF